MTKLTEDELQDHLRAQMRHLRNSSRLYDQGDPTEAVRLGTTLRILMQETAQSHSLLEQLGLRDSLDYVDTCLYRDEVNARNQEFIDANYPGDGLVVAAISPSEVGMVTFTGNNAGDLVWAPVFNGRGANLSPLAKWWDKPAVETTSGKAYCRRQVVSFMANKDGGAHIDPDVPVDWAAFKAEALGIQYADGGGYTEGGEPSGGWKNPSGNVANATMRQIAWEMEQSILRLALPWL